MATPTTFMGKSEVILLSPLSNLMPGTKFINEQTVVNLNLSLTLTGGSFSISLLRGAIDISGVVEGTIITLPFGRIGLVTSVGSGWSTGGMVDAISGSAVTFHALQQTFYGLNSGASASLLVIAYGILFGVGDSATAAIGKATTIESIPEWQSLIPITKNFSYRGQTLAGLQQVGSIGLMDLILRNDGYHYVLPGQLPSPNNPFIVNPTDIISANQVYDYSLDVRSILNPSLLQINAGLPPIFVYDSQHAQKQPKFTVQAGAPGSQGSSDHIDIPDGWLVDGNYEEWTPPSATDFTNPSATPTNGRYWKVFQSPTNPANLRGITNFTRLVKQIVIPGNVSSFVGSPITGDTKQGTTKEFDFDAASSNGGIYGFDSGGIATGLGTTGGGVSLFDVISHKFITFPNAIVLVPASGGSSGEAASNFYTITMEQWTFPLVNPQSFNATGSANPYGIPADVAVVTPNVNVLNGQNGYWNQYLSNYRLINSPRLKTTLSLVYRNNLPQPGDPLTVFGLTHKNCGRIQTVNITFSRSGGVVINLTAELYQAKTGKWSVSPGGSIIGGGSTPPAL